MQLLVTPSFRKLSVIALCSGDSYYNSHTSRDQFSKPQTGSYRSIRVNLKRTFWSCHITACWRKWHGAAIWILFPCRHVKTSRLLTIVLRHRTRPAVQPYIPFWRGEQRWSTQTSRKHRTFERSRSYAQSWQAWSNFCAKTQSQNS